MENVNRAALLGLVRQVARRGQDVIAYLKGTLLIVCCTATLVVLFIYDLARLSCGWIGSFCGSAVGWVATQAGRSGDDVKLLLRGGGSVLSASGTGDDDNVRELEEGNHDGDLGCAGAAPLSPGAVKASIGNIDGVCCDGEPSMDKTQAEPRRPSPPAMNESSVVMTSTPPSSAESAIEEESGELGHKEKAVDLMHFELREGEEEEASSFVPQSFGAKSAARPTKWSLSYLRESAKGGCGEIVGGGSFARVAAVYHSCGKRIAVKSISRVNENEDSMDYFIDSELVTLQKASVHPNVVDFYGYLKTTMSVYVVMPMVTTDLEASLQVSALSEEKSKGYIQQLLSALEFLDGKGIIHRDLKPANMLITADDKLLLADFGVALMIPNGETSVWDLPCGTKAYMAPELMVGEGEDAEMTAKVDVWGAGVLAFELVHGTTPFRSRGSGGRDRGVEAKAGTTGTYGRAPEIEPAYVDQADIEERENIRAARVTFVEGLLSEGAMDFVSKLLEINVQARPSASDASEHEWLGGPDRAADVRAGPSAALALREAELLAEKARQSQRRVVRRRMPARGRGGLGGGGLGGGGHATDSGPTVGGGA